MANDQQQEDTTEKAAKKRPAKPPAVVEQPRLDLTTESAPAGLLEQMEGDPNRQYFTAAQLTIPRVLVLQDMSPEVKEREAVYMPGARPGMVFNKLKKTLSKSILFIPSRHIVRYLAWRPRKDGGGLIDQSLTEAECNANFERDGISRWKGMMSVRKKGEEDVQESVRVEIIETPEWVGWAKSDGDFTKGFNWSPVAISFPKTKSKVAREINTIIDLTKLRGKLGQPFVPAPYFHLFKLDTVIEGAGKDSYYNWRAERLGWNENEELLAEGRHLWKSIGDGTAVVDEPTEADAA